MSRHNTLVSLILVAAVLVGCGRAATQPDARAVLTTDYEDALDVSSQLAMGILQLEETKHAVTSEQANTLLPLWRALQGEVTAEAEVDAALKQIAEAMTEDQLATIAEMRLTQRDVETWMGEHGVGADRELFSGLVDPEALATGRAEFGDGERLSGFEIPEELAARRGEFGDRGSVFGREMPEDIGDRFSEFQGMSEEDRAAMREAADGARIAPGFAPGAGQLRLFVGPLIELLSERAVVDNSL